ncbi:hypothetical protein [Chromobacterium vaccinii]|uniref:hypothetical protein n=1 Tax=Chromobacterium vaccinii TaxID=1108595 RepID=UPI001364BAB7|nr:hypothetical protein [Chromobacterium vaccinii]
MKKYSWNKLACMALFFSSTVFAGEDYQLPIAGGYTFSVISPNIVLAVGKEQKCTITNLKSTPGADPRLPLRLSNDEEYIILSEHDYISKNALKDCINQVKASSINSLLFDINKNKGLILSADIFSTSPDGYLADLYDTKLKKSIFQAKGFFNKRVSVEKQLANVFTLTSNGIISKDGRYISVNGDPDCTGDSYPGVYDIKIGKQINSSVMGELDSDALDLACKKLFK